MAWRVQRTRDQLDRQYGAYDRYAAACEYIRIGDVMRVMQRVGRPVAPETVLRLEALGRRLETAPRRRVMRGIKTVYLPGDIPQQRYARIKFPEWVR